MDPYQNRKGGTPSTTAHPSGPFTYPSPQRPSLFRWILLHGTLSVVPLTVLLTLLVALIFQNESSIPSSTKSDQYYYVDYSLSELLTVSSLLATQAMINCGFVMSLASYDIARRWVSASREMAFEKLHSPLQLALTIQLVGWGGVGSLWRLVLYYFGGKKYLKSPPSLKLAGAILLCTLGLGGLITVADTWLHVASSTISLDFRTPVLGQAATASYGRRLSDYCVDRMDKLAADGDDCLSCSPCLLNPAAAATFLMYENVSIPVAFNASKTHRVQLYDTKTQVLVPAQPDKSTDYNAKTFALESSCKPITNACNVRIVSGVQTLFDCRDSDFPLFKGNFENLTVYEAYKFTAGPDATKEFLSLRGTTANPFYWAAAIRIPSVSGELGAHPDKVIASSQHSTRLAVLSCQTEVLLANYEWTNGTIRSLSSERANDTVTKIVSSLASVNTYYSDILQYSQMVAAVEETPSAFAQSFANSFSRVFLSFFSGGTEPALNTRQYKRGTKLIAEVSKPALWFLILLVAIYVVFSFVLFLLAMIAAITHPDMTACAQMRLSVPAVLSRAIEPVKSRVKAAEVEELFEECHKDGPGADGVVRKRVVLQRNQWNGTDILAVEEQ